MFKPEGIVQIINQLLSETGPMNYEEDNYEAGYTHALTDLANQLGLEL